MSFETNVTLGIEVDSGELRSAKRAIEDELGDVTVGVSGGGAASRASGGGSAGGGASGQRSRRLFRWARQRTNFAEETVELLTQIEEDLDQSGGLTGGGGGGGGGAGLLGGVIGRASAGLGALGLGSLSLGTITAAGLTIGGTITATSLAVDAAEDFVNRGASTDLQMFQRRTQMGSTFDTPSSGQISRDLEAAGGVGLDPLGTLTEPMWLDRLERIMGQNLRITIEGDIQTDVSGGVTRGMQEEIADSVIEDVRDEFEGDLENLRQQIVSGIGRGSRGSRGRLSPRS